VFTKLPDGKIRINYSGWENHNVVLDGEDFVVSWGKQGVEGRIRRKRG
jgi:hypothetical protein